MSDELWQSIKYKSLKSSCEEKSMAGEFYMGVLVHGSFVGGYLESHTNMNPDHLIHLIVSVSILYIPLQVYKEKSLGTLFVCELVRNYDSVFIFFVLIQQSLVFNWYPTDIQRCTQNNDWQLYLLPTYELPSTILYHLIQTLPSDKTRPYISCSYGQ